MSKRRSELLLAGLIALRATSYLMSKLGLAGMGALNLLGVRFTLAFLVLGAIFHRRLLHLKPATVLRGALLGLVFFAVMTAELQGLKTTSTSVTSFLENTAILYVPLLEALLCRRRPSGRCLLGSGIAFAGVGLLTLGGSGFSFTPGEGFCLLAAVFYAAAIIMTDRFSRRDDPITLGVLEVGFLGLFAVLGTFLFETPTLPQSPIQWAAVLTLALVCTGLGFTLQPLAQRGTTAERAGLFCAINPAVALLLGVIVLHESLTWQAMLGCVLVLSSIVLTSLPRHRRLLHASSPDPAASRL